MKVLVAAVQFVPQVGVEDVSGKDVQVRLAALDEAPKEPGARGAVCGCNVSALTLSEVAW